MPARANLTIVKVDREEVAVLGEGELRKRVLAGGDERYHQANAAKGKLFARERIALLVDPDSFVEDGLMANDSTVKAGSWGARTVEKIIRIIETAYATGVPMVYLVDSAGARITDQV